MTNRVVKQLIWVVLAISTVFLSAFSHAKDNELVILTTFSREPLDAIVSEFKQRYPKVEVRLVHRRTQSAIQLLNRSYIKDVDLVLSSSPFLMQELSDCERLSVLDVSAPTPDWMRPFILPTHDQVAVLGYSGAGIVWNDDYLIANKLPKPQGFAQLVDPIYFGHITMSTPSRSGTTQMMVESILAQYGWQQGWQMILNVGANLGTISARSFGVSDYVAKGQFGIGPTIDSYALLLQKGFDHLSFAYDTDFTLMPTYMAVTKDNQQDKHANKFISMLLSKDVQSRIENSSFSKHSIDDSSLYSEKNPALNLKQVMVRQTLVNQIFDIAITQRLPVLKDTWLSLSNLQQNLKSKDHIQRLNNVKIKLFSLPLKEQDVIAVGEKITKLNKTQDMQKNQIQVLMAEFSHQLKNQLLQNQLAIEEEIRQIKAEAGL